MTGFHWSLPVLICHYTMGLSRHYPCVINSVYCVWFLYAVITASTVLISRITKVRFLVACAYLWSSQLLPTIQIKMTQLRSSYIKLCLPERLKIALQLNTSVSLSFFFSAGHFFKEGYTGEMKSFTCRNLPLCKLIGNQWPHELHLYLKEMWAVRPINWTRDFRFFR